MEILQMRYFLEVAKLKHVSKAAERLHLSQPSLTQSIKRLEEGLGVTLFERKGRGICLTRYGEFLQEKLTPIIESVDRLPFELQAFIKEGISTIKINVLAVSKLITDAIIEYQKLGKKVRFQLLQNAEEGDYDIEISTKMRHTAGNKEGRRFVKSEKIFLAVPDIEKYKNRSAITLKEVEKEGFICLFGSKQFRHICDKLCAQACFKPNVIFESDNPASVTGMIASNMGVGFYPEFSWGRIENHKVKMLEINDADFCRDIVVKTKFSEDCDERLTEFYDFLTQFIKNYK